MENEKKQFELNDENLILYLKRCIDKEYAKPLDEIDMDYINECVDFLLELQGIDATLTPEVIKEKVSEITGESIEEDNCNEILENTENNKKIKKNVTAKRIWLIAACIGLLIALFSMASVAFEWSVFDTLKDWFGSVADTPTGIEYEVGGMDVIRNGDIKLYSSIEEFVENEDINIMYPLHLPKNTVATEISISYIDGIGDISIVFNDGDLSCSITTSSHISQEILDVYTETLVINNLECHFHEMEDVSVVQVYFEHNNNLYMYRYNDKQTLIDIIKNLEEVQ